MSAGNIQLAAIGQQDALLTGTPSVTYFSGVYKRHTPFVLEAFEVPFMGSEVQYGTEATCRIPFKGDLVRGLTLKMTLPYLTDPGNNYSFPIGASSSFVPSFTTSDGMLRVAEYRNVAYYTTTSVTNWIGQPMSNYVSLDASKTKFVFSNTASVTVTRDMATFWGFDERTFNRVTPTGDLVYDCPRTSDWELDLAGWDRVASDPPASNRSGLFLELASEYTAVPFSPFGNFVNLSVWSNRGATALVTVTPGGCFRFAEKGLYQMTAILKADVPYESVALFANTVDTYSSLAPLVNRHTWRVSAGQPSLIPLEITDTSLFYFVELKHASGTTPPVLKAGSVITIGPTDQYFKLGESITLPSLTSPLRVDQFMMPSPAPRDNMVDVDATHGTFRFKSPGVYLVTVCLVSDTISGVSYGKCSPVGTTSRPVSVTYVDTYTTDTCTSPTINFKFPINVETIEQYYFLDVISKVQPNIIGPSSFVTMVQVTYNSWSSAFTQNGTMWRPNGLVTTGGIIRLGTSSFSQVGISNFIGGAVNGAVFIMVPGIYILTAFAGPGILSIRVGENVFEYKAPPHTVEIPFYVQTLSPSTIPGFSGNTTVSVTVTFDGSDTGTLPAGSFFVMSPFSTTVFESPSNYIDSVGTFAIRTADLYMGGQLIQSLPGEMIEIWNDLNVPLENQPALTLLVGKNDSSAVYAPNSRTYYTNLPFYFYGHPELSIPLAALTRHDVELRVSFRAFDELHETERTGVTLMNVTTIVEYAYLGESEVRWIQENRLDYVITQTQTTSLSLSPGFTTGIFVLPFTNPVRELFFVIQDAESRPYVYSDMLKSIGLTFNNTEAFDRDADFLSTVVPFRHYGMTPSRKFYVFSFARDPKDPRPSGQVNFSRIRQKLVEVTLTNGSSRYRDLRIHGCNYNVLRIENGLTGLLFNV